MENKTPFTPPFNSDKPKSNDDHPSLFIAVIMFVTGLVIAFFGTSLLYSQCDVYTQETYNQTNAYQNHIPFEKAHDWCLKTNGPYLQTISTVFLALAPVGSIVYIFSDEIDSFVQKLRGKKSQ